MSDAEKAELIAHQVAEKCCTGKDAKGKPKAPQRYAIIWQAAHLGALAAMQEVGQ